MKCYSITDNNMTEVVGLFENKRENLQAGFQKKKRFMSDEYRFSLFCFGEGEILMYDWGVRVCWQDFFIIFTLFPLCLSSFCVEKKIVSHADIDVSDFPM